MRRTQPRIVITVKREDRVHTFLVTGAHLTRKLESKLSVNSPKELIVHSLPPPHPAAIRPIASVLPSHGVNRGGRQLPGPTKNPTCPPHLQFPPRSDSP